jgi:hypothetical protein
VLARAASFLATASGPPQTIMKGAAENGGRIPVAGQKCLLEAAGGSRFGKIQRNRSKFSIYNFRNTQAQGDSLREAEPVMDRVARSHIRQQNAA